MKSPTFDTVLAAVAGAAAMLLLVSVVWLFVRRRRSRADLEAMLDAAQRECDDLRDRLDELTGAAGNVAPTQRRSPAPGAPDDATFVITHVGEPDADPGPAGTAVPDRLVLSATVGEPLVKVAAFSHGIRRALSAESRNRIWFEMRREVRASRRRRRQLRKRLEREYRANLRAMEDPVMDDRFVEGTA
jgi:hypothetical protein